VSATLRKRRAARKKRSFQEGRRRIHKRLDPTPGPERLTPMMTASNIHYEYADRVRGLGPGGIGALFLLARRIELVKDIDRDLHLGSGRGTFLNPDATWQRQGDIPKSRRDLNRLGNLSGAGRGTLLILDAICTGWAILVRPNGKRQACRSSAPAGRPVWSRPARRPVSPRARIGRRGPESVPIGEAFPSDLSRHDENRDGPGRPSSRSAARFLSDPWTHGTDRSERPLAEVLSVREGLPARVNIKNLCRVGSRAYVD
jgi:hypothetical protein